MKQTLFLIALTTILLSCKTGDEYSSVPSGHDLMFNTLASRWDEAIPQGNGLLGTLIWQKGDNLRFSLDRSDLWDLRPMHNLNGPQYRYKWVYKNWKNNTYSKVQQMFDRPYDASPAPSKIPGAAIEFNVKEWGKANYVHLAVDDALCEVKWPGGEKMYAFVDAVEPAGWFMFKNVKGDFNPVLVPPVYNTSTEKEDVDAHSGADLRRLGYPQGKITEGKNELTYEQEGWGGFKYMVHVTWEKKGNTVEGCWSITSEYPEWKKTPDAVEVVKKQMPKGFDKAFNEHKEWWDNFWAKSSVSLPDSVLERQWYLEQYKFGSAARNNTAPISLQAVWTADNGKLPPWKGDFHHDLNTQLSYWPAYSGNHLDLEEGFINWLWKYRETFKNYTKTYFETNGLNVPGVTTLDGKPMGGWIQYSFGPTVGAWLGQHFYLHWRYTMDRDFLAGKAYPWLKDVAIYLDEVSIRRKDGKRKLPISSSPEIHDNRKDAWFGETTNFDLSLIRFTYRKAAELAKELGKDKEAEKWEKILSEWPDLSVDEETGLMISPDLKFTVSHRHFSHAMAVYPLRLLTYDHDQSDRDIMTKTVNNLLKIGSDYWTGYSFSWLGNMQAQIRDGEGAAKTLRIFAENFCLPNSFHVNGEQHNRGYSKFKYRPFTLEGNFAFASGIQEMLIQSNTGIVDLFPAIPAGWNDVSFDKLRTEGAFLVSAEKKNGRVTKVTVTSEKGGTVKIKNPFDNNGFKTDAKNIEEGKIITIKMKPGETVVMTSK